MSKEYLEALEVIRNKFIDLFHEDIPDFDTVEDALNRLESIDNANPSEALECLEKLSSFDVVVGKTKKYDISTTVGNYFRCEITTIKRALLKAQEPKQYLKWEDLEFTRDEKVMLVKMGDTVYKISYRCDGIKEVQLLSEDEKLLYISFVGKYKDNIQFFNDLRLERVEE